MTVKPSASPEAMYADAVFLMWRLLETRPDLWKLAITESYRMTEAGKQRVWEKVEAGL